MWEDTKIVPCPFCDKGEIRVRYIPSLKKEVVRRGSAINKRATIYTKEHYTVLEDCPRCGASKEKIEKALNSGQDYRRPSREEILRRLKASGLPTRV